MSSFIKKVMSFYIMYINFSEKYPFKSFLVLFAFTLILSLPYIAFVIFNKYNSLVDIYLYFVSLVLVPFYFYPFFSFIIKNASQYIKYINWSTKHTIKSF